MGKDKLKRFDEVSRFENVLQFPDGVCGNWHQDIFKNQNPIVLELACGRGEYTLGLAKLYPNNNYVGIDMKGARIWRGAKTALEDKVKQVRFLRIFIERISTYFSKNEVDELWITFPDLHPPIAKAKKRLTSIRFLFEYKSFLKDGGIIHLKTDDKPLFDFTLQIIDLFELEVLDLNHNVSLSFDVKPELQIITTYESRWRKEGKPIQYVAFRLEHDKLSSEKKEVAEATLHKWMTDYRGSNMS